MHTGAAFPLAKRPRIKSSDYHHCSSVAFKSERSSHGKPFESLTMKLHVLIVCCALVVAVNASVYVKGGSRYPFPRPNQSNVATPSKGASNNKQSSFVSNRRYQREALKSGSVIGDTPATESRRHPKDAVSQLQQGPSISSQPTLSAAVENGKRPDAGAEFEDQRPIDFDLNVRTGAQFVPGLKSVSN
ncbi:hypothetical protein GHT06_016636 [Daphnia sinensis]|uniref:Uncharacterized protein n=1 Tax=Daphnia sinensis TaxID=1820382 RepID=A0AAD5PU63_9CRUS|nr:hypothetical protein GHT06_016636 [Daphnia sinensis]